MQAIRCFQVNAFAERRFSGNPAAVCLLDADADPTWMQAIAAEMNLSETAFVRRSSDGFNLRWFTPKVEVDLCGHATLASAHVLWSERIVPSGQSIRFQSKSGALTCSIAGHSIELDFPATGPRPSEPPPGLLEALNVEPSFVGKSRFDFLVAVDSAQVLRSLSPDIRRLVQVDARGIIVTSPSDDPRFDFLSRFFAPRAGVDEDPVTGSAHCSLGPFWAEKLNKTEMVAFQASARGGIVRVRVTGDRVVLGGQAVTIWRGELA